MIIACVPVDRSQLPQGPELDAVVVTDLYTLKNCAQCEQAIWVGPRQLATWTKERHGWLLLCYLCSVKFMRSLENDLDAEPLIVDLGGGSTREGRPRTL